MLTHRRSDATLPFQHRNPSKATAHAQENKCGMTAGDGPGANGLSQGSNKKKKMTGFNMIEKIAERNSE